MRAYRTWTILQISGMTALQCISTSQAGHDLLILGLAKMRMTTRTTRGSTGLIFS